MGGEGRGEEGRGGGREGDGGTYRVGSYGMEWVHNREPDQSRVTSEYLCCAFLAANHCLRFLAFTLNVSFSKRSCHLTTFLCDSLSFSV